MGSTKDIDIISLIVCLLFLVVPITLTLKNGVNIIKDISVSASRMIAQLVLIGFILQFLFKHENVLMTSFWLFVMLVFANLNLISKTKIKVKGLWLYTFFPMLIGSSIVVTFFVFVVVRPEEVFSARYLIPVYGMILGNSMNGNILAMERFISSIRKDKDEYITLLALGGTESESSHSQFVAAYKAALMPLIATMSAMGLVSLPGMMTGQILGGSLPLSAIKYQIGIVVMIFSSVSISSMLLLIMIRRKIFDRNGMPKQEYLK
jgi:putative ABC transport system permease protein